MAGYIYVAWLWADFKNFIQFSKFNQTVKSTNNSNDKEKQKMQCSLLIADSPFSSVIYFNDKTGPSYCSGTFTHIRNAIQGSK